MTASNVILTIDLARRQERYHFPSLINLDMPFCGDHIEEAFYLAAADGPNDPHGVPNPKPV
jgi:hypothetical protein